MLRITFLNKYLHFYIFILIKKSQLENMYYSVFFKNKGGFLNDLRRIKNM